MSRGASQVPSVSRLFPFTAPILQVLVLGANKVGGSADKSSLFPLEAWILVSQGLLAKP